MTIDSNAARMEMNARAYKYDATLDAAADLMEQGPAAWSSLPRPLLSVASVHKDLRDHYRAAVAAGVIPDDRNAANHKEN